MGRRVIDIDAATREAGYELRMHPTTKRMATIGGFAARGSGGVGSVTFGGLRELGDIMGARVVSSRKRRASCRVEGRCRAEDCHAWGTTGIATAIEMPLAPAYPWIDVIAALKSYRTLSVSVTNSVAPTASTRNSSPRSIGPFRPI